MYAATQPSEPAAAAFGSPQIFFFCELSGPALAGLIDGPHLAMLAERGYGVALALGHLDETTAAAARQLNRRGIPLVAWLPLSPADGSWFNLRNYPQAGERYRSFQAWARDRQLQFQAVGLSIEPPTSVLEQLRAHGLRHLVRRVRQANENGLFAAARGAYTDLIAAIHHDGYEVHTYQLPILADDRRTGSTLAQRTLDIVDLPADVEVLLCYSSVPVGHLGDDLDGALVLSYGPDADGIGLGVVGGGEGLPSLSWDALERDLLLAGRHTDTIYIATLEGCAERGLLPRIARIDWDGEPQHSRWKLATVQAARVAVFTGLFLARFSRSLFAWLGWGLFALLLSRELRAAMARR